MARQDRAQENSRKGAESPRQSPSISAPELGPRSMSPGVIQRLRASSGSISPNDVMALQGTIGNRATRQLLHGGGRRSSAGARGRTPLVIQPKLSVGAASDRFEQEADLVAQQVTGSQVRAPAPRRAEPSALLQRSSSLEGGDVDSAMEDRIHRSQGGGEPMPRGVRDALEPKLNVDLGGVRVHTDGEAARLSSSIGATAFTHKNHIYYGASQSPEDLRLTAHEVVHTIQQGATPSPRGGAGSPGASVQRSPDAGVIQRNVGFEFESGNTKVRYPVNDQAHPDEVYECKDILAVKEDQYDVTSDSGDLEIVTKDFPETPQGKQALDTALQSIELYCRSVGQLGVNRDAKKVATIGRLAGIAEPRTDGFRPYQIAAPANGNITSHPQATAGVELDKLYTLLSDMSNKQSETFAKTGWDMRQQWEPTIVGVQNAVRATDAFIDTLPNDKNYDKLKGLMAQIYNVVLTAKKWRYKKAKYAKYLMPIMQRTDFGTIYSQLAVHEKEAFVDHRDALLKAAEVKGDDLLFPGGIKEWGNDNFTITEFLDKMTQGREKDVLSGTSNAGSGWIGEDKIGPTPQKAARVGAIVELRRLKNNVEYSDFRSFALGVFDVITMLNQGQTFDLVQQNEEQQNEEE